MKISSKMLLARKGAGVLERVASFECLVKNSLCHQPISAENQLKLLTEMGLSSFFQSIIAKIRTLCGTNFTPELKCAGNGTTRVTPKLLTFGTFEPSSQSADKLCIQSGFEIVRLSFPKSFSLHASVSAKTIRNTSAESPMIFLKFFGWIRLSARNNSKNQSNFKVDSWNLSLIKA